MLSSRMPPPDFSKEKWQPAFTRPLEDVSPAKNLQAVLRVGAILNWDADPYDRRTIADSSPAEGGMYFMLKGSDSWYYAKLSINSEGQTLIKVSRLIEEGDARETPAGWSESHFISPEKLKPYQRDKYLSEFIAEGMGIQMPGGMEVISKTKAKGKGLEFYIEGSNVLYFAGLKNGGVQLWKYSKGAKPSGEGENAPPKENKPPPETEKPRKDSPPPERERPRENAPPERESPPRGSGSGALSAKASAMMEKFDKFNLFEAEGGAELSPEPKIIGINSETNRFILDAVPENVIYAQSQLNLIHEYVVSESGSTDFINHLQKKLAKFYANIGLPGNEYVFSAEDKGKIKEILTSLQQIKGLRYGGGGLTRKAWRGMSGSGMTVTRHDELIDTLSTGVPNILLHELVHSSQGRTSRGNVEQLAEILSVGSNGAYTSVYKTRVENLIKLLKKLPEGMRKTEADKFVRSSFGF